MVVMSELAPVSDDAIVDLIWSGRYAAADAACTAKNKDVRQALRCVACP